MNKDDTQLNKKILLFGQHSLQITLLNGYISQFTGIVSEPVDGNHWNETYDTDTHYLALIDVSEGTPDKLIPLLDHLCDQEADITVAFFNVTDHTEVEQLILWPMVKGVFYREGSQEHLCRGIEGIFAGEYWLPRQLMGEYLERTRQRPRHHDEANILTRREKQILQFTATGATNTQIAQALNVSMHTVKTHIYNLFRKIGVSNRVQAINWAKENLADIEREAEKEKIPH